MVDGRTGYGERGEGDTYRVLRTTDGARTWDDITPGGGTYRATSPVTTLGNTLLFSTRVRNGRFAVERSDDRGRNWRQSLPFRDRRGSPAAGQPFAIDRSHLYLAVNEGAAAGSSAQALYTSSDGGHRWTFISATQNSTNPSPSQLPLGCDKDGFGFATPSRGFAGGYCAGGAPFFYRTDDGGHSWHRQHLPVPRQCACDTTPPVFFTASTGVLSVYGYAANGNGKPFTRIFWTHDGGIHWREARPPAGRTNRPGIVDANIVWVTGQAPGAARTPFDRLFRTSDGGSHWQTEKLRFNGQNYQLDPIDQRSAFALNVVLGTRSILVTHDGGSTWQAVTPRLRR